MKRLLRLNLPTIALVALIVVLTIRCVVQLRCDSLNTRLLQAIRAGDLPSVETALKSGADPNAIDNASGPVRSMFDFVARLIGNSPPARSPDSRSAPLLMLYPESGGQRIEDRLEAAPIAAALLKYGANPNSPDANGETPLHLAAMANHLDTVRLLLQHGANPNPRDRFGSTPLMYGALNSPELLEALLSHGADPNLARADGWTPLVGVARATNVPELAQILLRYGANAAYRDSYGNCALDYARRAHHRKLLPVLERAMRDRAAHR